MRLYIILICIAALIFGVYYFLNGRQQPQVIGPPPAPPPPVVQAPPPVAPPVVVVHPPPPPPPVVIAKPVPPPVPVVAKPVRPNLNPQLVAALAAVKQADADYYSARSNAINVLNANPDYIAKVKQVHDMDVQLTAEGDATSPEFRQQWFTLKGQVTAMEAGANKTPFILAARDRDIQAQAALTDAEQRVDDELRAELGDAVVPMAPAGLEMVKYHARDGSLVVLFQIAMVPRIVTVPTSDACLGEIESAMKGLRDTKIQWQCAQCAVCFPDHKVRRIMLRGKYARATINGADFNLLDHPPAGTAFLDQPIITFADEFEAHPDLQVIAKSGVLATARPDGKISVKTFATYSDNGDYVVTAKLNR